MYCLIDVSNHGNIKWALVRIAAFCCAHRPHYDTKIKSLYLVMYCLIDVSKHGNIKWVLVRIAAFCCAHRPQIWIPEIL